MKTCLLVAALALVTVWATGCIIIDAGKVQGREPVTVRSATVEVQQRPATTPATEESIPTPGADVIVEATVR
jgi:hypothetical protein